MLWFERPLLLDSAVSPPELHSTQIVARLPEPRRRTVIDNNDLFLAPGLCDRVGKAFTVSQKAMRTHRTPKALCAKSWEGPILFRESLRSAHASTRRFWERPLFGSRHFTFVTLFCELRGR